jgi:hypothetical protein
MTANFLSVPKPLAGDTFWARKPIYGRTKYHWIPRQPTLVNGCGIWGEPSRAGIPIMNLYA